MQHIYDTRETYNHSKIYKACNKYLCPDVSKIVSHYVSPAIEPDVAVDELANCVSFLSNEEKKAISITDFNIAFAYIYGIAFSSPHIIKNLGFDPLLNKQYFRQKVID